MELLLEKLELSIEHLLCLDRTFQQCSEIYKEISNKLSGSEFKDIYTEISRELYAGGKKTQGNLRLSRQMILGDVIEYIFTGRVFYYACKSKDNLKNFIKLIFYIVNQLLIMDSITVNNDLRRCYITNLINCIPKEILFEKEDDMKLAEELLTVETKLNDKNWGKYDAFIDSLLPKTLGCPKELVVFTELIRMKVGIILPLLLIQKLFNEKDPISPPDFLLLRNNKEIYGIEVGYNKEAQSREFSLRTSIPTFAVDLEENMHNRCPVCGEFILYCDKFIEKYSNGENNIKLMCNECDRFNNGDCIYSTYYGKYIGNNYNGERINEKKSMHYHTKCVKNGYYLYRNTQRNILSTHINEFYAQVPKIQGIESISK